MNALAFQLAVSLLVGAALGLFYFGGLWLTVHRARRAAHPYRLLAGSFLVRVAGLLAALWLIMSSGWQHVAVAMVGFLIARQALVFTVRQFPKKASEAKL